MKTIEDRILAIEKKVGKANIAGTILSRSDNYELRKLQWTLGIGLLCEPKLWFYGDTIEDVLTQAEKECASWKKSKK